MAFQHYTKTTLCIICFLCVAGKIKSQNKEIIFKAKDGTTAVFKHLYNNPDYLPAFHASINAGALNLGNIASDESPYTLQLNFGGRINKRLSFAASYMTLIPEFIIYKNNEYSEDPFYKSFNFIDFTAHYNLLSHIKERFRDEKLITYTKVAYWGKIPKTFSDNLSLDIGVNRFNYYDAAQLYVTKNVNNDLVNQTRTGDIAFTSAKFGLSYFRTESRKYSIAGEISEKAKQKRFYALLTYAVNHKYDIIYSEYKYVSNTRKTDKEYINNALTPAPKISPVGFRIGFESQYFYPGKVNFFGVLGLEFGAIPRLEFYDGYKTYKWIAMAHLGLGLFDKIHVK